MIYIVSGFMRTGTSAMMASLIAGGMEAAWSPQRDMIAARQADDEYHPNKSGLFEIPLDEYNSLDFPLQYQGKLIKIMAWGIDKLSVNDDGYRVILMRRDKEEIRQSYEAFFNKPLQMPWFKQYNERMINVERMLKNRLDVLSTNVIHYRNLASAPACAFDELRLAGWPIDTQRCADEIDSTQYRFRKELLTIGI